MGKQAGTPAFFDAHCDTVMKVLDNGADFLHAGGTSHVSFPGMVQANVRAQVFACFVLSAQYEGREYERACRMIDTVYDMASSTDGALRVILNGAELQEAFADGPRAAILGLEGADPLQGKAETIHDFYERGVRDLIFAWQDNAFSGTAFGKNTPLTSQGKRLLGLCEELGVVVDVSHASDTAFDDVVGLAERPFVASHSNCRALCPSARNLSDQMIRALAEAGGVMGINLQPSFLDPASLSAVWPLWEKARRPGISESEKRRLLEIVLGLPRPKIDWVARHVLHAIDVGGEDCIGLGGDLDGISQTPEGFDSVADYGAIVSLLQSAGLSDAQIEKVLHKNFLRVYTEALPAC